MACYDASLFFYSKTTFVTVNLDEDMIDLTGYADSKTTFVTVNLVMKVYVVICDEFKNNFCYC